MCVTKKERVKKERQKEIETERESERERERASKWEKTKREGEEDSSEALVFAESRAGFIGRSDTPSLSATDCWTHRRRRLLALFGITNVLRSLNSDWLPGAVLCGVIGTDMCFYWLPGYIQHAVCWLAIWYCPASWLVIQCGLSGYMLLFYLLIGCLVLFCVLIVCLE